MADIKIKEVKDKTIKGLDKTITWTENEHKLNYKKKLISDSTKQKLKGNADIIWNVDLSMNDLFKKNRKKISHIDKLSLF